MVEGGGGWRTRSISSGWVMGVTPCLNFDPMPRRGGVRTLITHTHTRTHTLSAEQVAEKIPYLEMVVHAMINFHLIKSSFVKMEESN